MNTLKAEKRDMKTKAKKLRREGFVTGVIFGKEMEEAIPLQIAVKDAERFLKTGGKGSKVTLDIEGTAMEALVKEVDYNPLKRQILEIDFQALVKGEKVHSTAEIVLLNHDKVQEGVLEKVLNEVSYRALPESLVEKIEIDVASMKVGDTIKVGDLPIASDKKVDLMTDPESVIVTVMEVHGAPSEPEETEETKAE
ncbi:MAG TPA: 50S ribosomal protein L25 [Candidatus Choladousia intestinigallinarum]|nr:50S ribosomal protein L25 [Candidatus Choladousia intestinigallinarum]